jgi:hypothetical protein
MENNILKKRVMSRIYINYAKNSFIKNSEFFALDAVAGSMSLFISFPAVFQNMPKDNVVSTYNFLKSALNNTERSVQIESLALLACFFVYGFKMTFRNIYKLKIILKVPTFLARLKNV